MEEVLYAEECNRTRPDPGVYLPGSERTRLLRRVVAYAESDDARAWGKPNLGLYEHRGATSNNLIFSGFGEKGRGIHGFAPYKDANPDAVFISLAPLWRVTV